MAAADGLPDNESDSTPEHDAELWLTVASNVVLESSYAGVVVQALEGPCVAAEYTPVA